MILYTGGIMVEHSLLLSDVSHNATPRTRLLHLLARVDSLLKPVVLLCQQIASVNHARALPLCTPPSRMKSFFRSSAVVCSALHVAPPTWLS